VAPIGPNDVPGTAFGPRSPSGRSIAPSGALAVSGAPHGQIAIAGAARGEPGHGLLIQGAAQGPFASLPLPGGLATAPMSLDGAYLGDVGLASARAEGAGPSRLRFDVERYFARRLSRDVTVTAPATSVRALTLALDYRTDAVVVWAQGSSLYARDLPASGAQAPTQRLGSADAGVRVAALLSDDNRAIVAWADDRAGVTSVYLDRSAAGVRFGSPTLLERFRDPDGLGSPAASPRLIRLSSESVMIAWAGSSSEHWAVRAAPIDLRGLGTVTTIAAPTGDALLADLVPGPDDDALALWTEPLSGPGGSPDMGHQAILAARGFDAYPGRAIFGTPESVATPAPVLDAGAAIDPSDDRAIAMWRGEGAVAEYSVRTGPAAH
jgi:hypothetical protein